MITTIPAMISREPVRASGLGNLKRSKVKMAIPRAPPRYSRRLRFLIRFSNRRALTRISSSAMGLFSRGWFCQTLGISSGRGSFGMGASFMKGAGQDVLDAVNFGGDIARRQAVNLADSRRVQAFQVGQDDLAIQRLQALDRPRVV